MPSEVRLADVRRLLEEHGYTLDRIKGSHHHFRKVGGQGITIPVHRGKVKPVYVAIVRKALGIER